MDDETLIARIERNLKDCCITQTDLQVNVSYLAEYLYFNLHRFKIFWFEEDSRSDFIVWLYPYLSKILKKYNPDRALLSTYLYMAMQNYYHIFMTKRFEEKAKDHVLLNIQQSAYINLDYTSYREDNEVFIEQAIPRYEFKIKNKVLTEKQKEIFSRKIFLLVCKSEAFIDDSFIDVICANTTIDKTHLLNTLTKIRDINFKKKEKICSLKEDINELYITALRCKHEMEEIKPDSNRFLKLQKKYTKCCIRIKKMQNQLKKQKTAISNRELGELIEMSRGTVDITLVNSLKGLYSEEL